MAKRDIGKLIQSQQKNTIPRIGPIKPSKGGMFDDSPMLMAAQAFIENMNWKYKLAIGSAVYFLLAGVVGTGIGIVKLINLIF